MQAPKLPVTEGADGSLRPKTTPGVLLVGNYPNDGQESMQRFGALMLQGLQDAGVPVQLLVPKPIFGRLKRSGHGLGKWLGYLDKLLLFPIALKRAIRRADRARPLVVHICDHSNAVYTKYLQHVPNLVTCHDLLAVRSALGEFPQNPTRWSGRRLQSMILRHLNGALHVTCCSQATRQDLRRLCSLAPAQTSIIPVALNYPYSPMPEGEARFRINNIAQRAGIPAETLAGGFLFHVGGNQWYKNRMGVLRIYSHLLKSGAAVPSLWMAGKQFAPEMVSFIAEHRLGQRVWPLEDCDNEDLRALYTRASALVFPSLAEGFGWPVIEAQACGCPVACSDLEPFPEVAGEAAVFCDPADEPAFAKAVLNVIGDAPLRQSLIAKGLGNATRYGLPEMISRYLECYARLIPVAKEVDA
ncbi:MAG: glycosyltransferase family 1 protein [Verrucomicrobiota bacterium]